MDSLQFIECYKWLNDQAPLSTSAPKMSKKLSQIGWLVAHELDTDSEAEEDTSLDPLKPWLDEYDRYMNTHESIPDDMTTVQWWGVHIMLNRFQ